MRRVVVLGACAVVFVLQASWSVYTQTAKPPGPLRTERVKGDLYMVSGEGGNVALYTTSEGVVLVDDMFDRNHADILAQIKSVTNQPLRYVINTHQHDDHAGGDFKMLPIAEVIAHRNVRANLADIKRPYYEDTPGTPIGLPRITFSNELAVNLGGKEVQAHYFGRGHTSGDAMIYLPRGEDHPHRRPVPGAPSWRQGRSATPGAAARCPDLRRLRAGRQLPRLVEDDGRDAEARFRHGDPGARPGVDARRCRQVQGRPRDDAHAAHRSDQGQADESRAREDPRGRLRLAIHGMSAESADRRMSSVPAAGRADAGVGTMRSKIDLGVA